MKKTLVFTIAYTIMILLLVGFPVYVVSTQALGIPLWWVFRGVVNLTAAMVGIQLKFNITIIPEAPRNIGDSVLITVLNASDQKPVEGARISLSKNGDFIFEYQTNASGQAEVEFLGEVTVIRVSKANFKPVVEAIPHAPAKWVRDQYTSLVVGVISAVAGAIVTHILQNRKKR